MFPSGNLIASKANVPLASAQLLQLRHKNQITCSISQLVALFYLSVGHDFKNNCMVANAKTKHLFPKTKRLAVVGKLYPVQGW